MIKLVRVGLHGLVLTVADIGGIAGGGVAAYKVLGTPNEVWLQLPIAVVMSVALFWAWLWVLWVLGFRKLQWAGARERLVCLAVSLLWNPAVFVPLHYFTQGYVTSPGNLLALALYQFPVNALALFGPGANPGAGTGPNTAGPGAPPEAGPV